MSPLLQEALALALQLNPKERLQLVEQVVASVEHQLDTQYPPTPSEKHWGKNLLRLLDELGSIELDHPILYNPACISYVSPQVERDGCRHPYSRKSLLHGK